MPTGDDNADLSVLSVFKKDFEAGKNRQIILRYKCCYWNLVIKAKRWLSCPRPIRRVLRIHALAFRPCSEVRAACAAECSENSLPFLFDFFKRNCVRDVATRSTEVRPQHKLHAEISRGCRSEIGIF